MKKQKGRIVTVELPYATNVLIQELASIANIGLRLVTTGDTERLRPLKTKIKLNEEQAIEEAETPLDPIQYPEPFEEKRFEEEQKEETEISPIVSAVTNPASEQVLEGAQDLQKAGIEQGNAAVLQEGLQAEADGIVAPANPGLPQQPQQPQQEQQQQVPVIQSGGAISNDFVVQVSKQEGGMSLTIQQPKQQQQQQQQQQVRTITQAPKNEIVYPSRTEVFPPSYPGQPPTIAIQGGYTPQLNPIISVDTGPEAMAADGFGFSPEMSQQGGRRRFQRGPLELPSSFQQQQQSPGTPVGKFTVNKLG